MDTKIDRCIDAATAPRGLYTILPLPILYGVYGIPTGGSGGGRILRNSRAMVLR